MTYNAKKVNKVIKVKKMNKNKYKNRNNNNLFIKNLHNKKVKLIITKQKIQFIKKIIMKIVILYIIIILEFNGFTK